VFLNNYQTPKKGIIAIKESINLFIFDVSFNGVLWVGDDASDSLVACNYDSALTLTWEKNGINFGRLAAGCRCVFCRDFFDIFVLRLES